MSISGEFYRSTMNKMQAACSMDGVGPRRARLMPACNIYQCINKSLLYRLKDVYFVIILAEKMLFYGMGRK